MNSLKMDSGLHSLLPLRLLKTCWWNSNSGEEQRFLGQRKLEQLKPGQSRPEQQCRYGQRLLTERMRCWSGLHKQR